MTTPRGRSTRRSSPRRKARPRLSGAQGGFLGARPADEPLHRPRAHYFHTPKAGGEVDRGHPTQVGQPSSNSGLSTSAPIHRRRGPVGARVRNASGSSVNELALAGLTDIAAANAFIAGLPARSQRPLRHPAAGEGSAFTPIPASISTRSCASRRRQVGHDNFVSYRTLKLQIPTPRGRISSARSSPRLADGSHALFHGRAASPLRRQGTIKDAKRPLKSARRPNRDGTDKPSACPTRPQQNKPEEADTRCATKTGQINSLSTVWRSAE